MTLAPADLPPDPPRNSPEAVIRHDDDGTLSITFYPEDARWVVCSREVMEQYVTDLNALATERVRADEATREALAGLEREAHFEGLAAAERVRADRLADDVTMLRRHVEILQADKAALRATQGGQDG